MPRCAIRKRGIYGSVFVYVSVLCVCRCVHVCLSLCVWTATNSYPRISEVYRILIRGFAK